jgi:hypothetical protein
MTYASRCRRRRRYSMCEFKYDVWRDTKHIEGIFIDNVGILNTNGAPVINKLHISYEINTGAPETQ